MPKPQITNAEYSSVPQEQQSLKRTITHAHSIACFLLKHCTTPLARGKFHAHLPALAKEGMVPSERALLRRPGREDEEVLRGDLKSCWFVSWRILGGVGTKRDVAEEGKAAPVPLGKRAMESPERYLQMTRMTDLSHEHIPVTPPLSCISSTSICFVTRFLLVFQCRSARCSVFKSLWECSYTFETRERRTAQPYLTYHAPTCPRIQGEEMVEQLRNTGTNTHSTLVFSLDQKITQRPPECFTKSRCTEDQQQSTSDVIYVHV